MLKLFRRRATAPADLPPVSGASMPGPLHSGLTGSWPNAVMAGASVLAAAVASAEATHAAKTTVEPATGPDDRVCAYRDPYTGQLVCPTCYESEVSVLWTPRTSDDLPRGGLCSMCDVDVLMFLDPEPTPVVWPAVEPPISYASIPGAAPLGGRPPLWRPGTYTVTYDRLLGLAPPAPLTVEALTASDLTTAIARDVRALTGHDVSVIADLVMDGGTIRGASGKVGSFTYTLRAGGAR